MEYHALPRQAHEFQQPPSAAEVERLCRQLLPAGAAAERATEIGGGMFNNTFLIAACNGGRYVLRVGPPHGHTALFSNERYLMRRELALGPALAAVERVAPLLPRVLATQLSDAPDGRDAVLSAYIEGENWDAIQKQLPAAENDAIWRELGELLARIHQVRGTAFGWTTPERPHATWSAFVLAAARGLLDDYARLKQDDAEARPWLTAAEAGAAILDEISVPRLVHGDPWPKNVLVRQVEGRWRIVGLLDHERGLWGDPMDEWVFHMLNFPPAFWEAYGPQPGGPAATFRALVYRGLIDTQALLEGWRYRIDASGLRTRLTETTRQMAALHAELGLY